MESITISFHNNEKEFGQAMRIYYNRTFKFWFDLVLSLLAIFVGAGLWMNYGYSRSWIYLIEAGVFCSLIFGLVNFIVPIIRFRQEPKYKDKYSLAFSETGIDFKTAHLNSKVEWSYYNKVWESERLYLLIYGKNLFSLIPKRAFCDKSQEETFRKFIQEKNLEIIRV